MMGVTENSVFKRPFWVAVFALTAAVAWGWAFPLVKLGFKEFSIMQEMTAVKMLFAGLRFTFSGVIILAIAFAMKRNFRIQSKNGWLYVFLFSLMNTTLHYTFFYIGLSHTSGSRAAILNSLGVFLLVIFASVFFKSDRLTLKKIVGCMLGFSGLVALNLGGGSSGDFSFMGDGMIILNAFCSAFAGLMIRGLGRRVDVFVGTGYSLAIGGFILILIGLFNGAVLPVVTLKGIGILILLIAISSLGFALYNKLLSCNPVGKVAIFNSLIPVVGAVTSCICLNEPFYGKYIVAALLAMSGIYIINKDKA